MTPAIVGLVVASLLQLGGAHLAVASDPPVTSDKPNIVVFYIDDASPHDGRLWNDPTLTPAIHDTFVAHGLKFTNAIGEDPLCCPARANLLTGLHTHNNGVAINDARLFNPQMHVGRALRDAGYASMFIGKYMNKNSLLSTEQWQQHADGWSVLDAIFGWNGAFTDYRVRTKDSGDIAYGAYHSTLMVGDRAVMRMREVSSDTPIFQLLSFYNLHSPNTPVPMSESDYAKCDSMGPWWTPAFNEADVSDKPAYVRDLPLLTNLDGTPMTDGWPMAGYCREMLGVDLVVKQVTDELAAEGRLDNTLLVFTADNGMDWGAHRRGQRKLSPYSTPLPLYMAWADRWGSVPRTVTDHTSNIDLAPTFCDVGGCTLGPYPRGQSGPDGVSLLPYLDSIVQDDGAVPNLGRDALLEQTTTWWAVRTTALNSLGLWHYVEYATGERELYDMEADPYQLQNLASDGAYSDVKQALATRLDELRQEGLTARPDGSIALTQDGVYKGDGFYLDLVDKRQTQRRSNVLRNSTHDYFVHIDNDGPGTDSINVQAYSTGTSRMRVSYFIDGLDVTPQVTGGGYTFSDLESHARVSLVVRIHVGPRALRNSIKRAMVRVRSVAYSTQVDVVRAIAAR